MSRIAAVTPQNAIQICFFGERLASARHCTLLTLSPKLHSDLSLALWLMLSNQ